MSIARSCAAVVAAVLPVLGCRGGGAGGPKVTLRYHPPAGAAYHYAMEQQNSMRIEGGPMSAMPEQQLTMRMYFTQLVGGPTDGGTAVTVTFDSTALEAPGMMPGAMQPALDRMRGMKSDVVYDERMQVVRAAFTGLAGTPNPVTEELGKNLKAMAFPLPAAPVGVGDSWTAERELALGEQVNASAPVKSHNKLTVKEIQVTGADTAVLLAVETTFPGDPIELSQQGQHVTMRLSGGLTGEQLYSLTKSAPVRGTMSGTLRIHVKGATQAQGEMTMAMTQQTTLRLTGAPAPAP
jgi:hypothetical protein